VGIPSEACLSEDTAQLGLSAWMDDGRPMDRQTQASRAAQRRGGHKEEGQVKRRIKSSPPMCRVSTLSVVSVPISRPLMLFLFHFPLPPLLISSSSSLSLLVSLFYFISSCSPSITS
jgi:hypothetical protein